MRIHRKLLFLLFILCLLFLQSCHFRTAESTDVTNETSTENGSQVQHNTDEKIGEEAGEVVEKTTYSQVFCIDGQYFCTFYDKDHNMVRTEGPYSKIPKVSVVNDSNPTLLRLTIQTGTGIGTQYGYFYLVDEMKFSETFQSILDQSENLVAYIDKEKVIVRDIFDKTKYDKEISDFCDHFSNVAQPITNASFSEDSKTITVTYLTGDNFREVSETFEI